MAAITPDRIDVLSVGNKKMTVGHFTTQVINDDDTWATGLSSLSAIGSALIWTEQTSAGPTDLQVDGVSAGTLTFDCAASTNGRVFILSADY